MGSGGSPLQSTVLGSQDLPRFTSISHPSSSMVDPAHGPQKGQVDPQDGHLGSRMFTFRATEWHTQLHPLNSDPFGSHRLTWNAMTSTAMRCRAGQTTSGAIFSRSPSDLLRRAQNQTGRPKEEISGQNTSIVESNSPGESPRFQATGLVLQNILPRFHAVGVAEKVSMYLLQMFI